MIIQNATFMKRVDESIFTISLLQDDLRGMKKQDVQQEDNLKKSQKLVANSLQTAKSYQEYEFDIIPIGLDSELFRPCDKNIVRKKYGYENNDFIGIFVGSFSDVKGWNEMQTCFNKHPNVKFIAVTKYDEYFSAPNVNVFSRVSQSVLAELYNCAVFFLFGVLR